MCLGSRLPIHAGKCAPCLLYRVRYQLCELSHYESSTGVVVCDNLPAPSEFRSASTEIGFSTNSLESLLTAEVCVRVVSTRSLRMVYNHILKELDADDWSPRPILYQACLASTLCRGQRFAGGEVYVILIVFAEYSVKRLEHRKRKLCDRWWIYATVGNERARTESESTHLGVLLRRRGLLERCRFAFRATRRDLHARHLY